MKTIFTVLALCGAAMAQGQSLERQVIGATGGEGTAGGVTLSWTVGETVTATGATGSLILTQGFQQPNPAANSVKTIAASDWKAYPNPNTGLMYIDFTGTTGKRSVEVTDAAGRVVLSETVFAGQGQKHVLNLQAISGGWYTLKVTEPANNRSEAVKFVISK
ncbi:MAG: T9SS type A sorting domain-containing protein [Bacteroidetes bacterium]|nr:T9SS type A sorting domain-containing protein [Bacteroidota bacterium]